MKNEQLVRIWLKRAKSNLQIAKAGKVFDDILYEDLWSEDVYVVKTYML